jgi:NadR type nicotinamide-nucleotide adenylyltransferase
MPPHRGHLHLISEAAKRVDALTVIIFIKPDEPIPGELRYRWLQELAGEHAVICIDDEYPVDYDDPAVWDLWIDSIRRRYPVGPDIVFSSEEYGEELARRLGAENYTVDIQRETVPVSATAIRDDPMGHWDDIPNVVRPWFIRRVAIVGAESTGKSALAEKLADRFQTCWVDEYAREHIAERGGICLPEDLPIIAHEQRRREDAASLVANRLLFCDTEPLTTTIWSEHYFNDCDPEIQRMANDDRYGLYLLCYDDVPWIDDGLRDSPNDRAWFTERFTTELAARNRRVVVIDGDFEKRFRVAFDAVAEFLTEVATSIPSVISLRSLTPPL